MTTAPKAAISLTRAKWLATDAAAKNGLALAIHSAEWAYSKPMPFYGGKPGVWRMAIVVGHANGNPCRLSVTMRSDKSASVSGRF